MKKDVFETCIDSFTQRIDTSSFDERELSSPINALVKSLRLLKQDGEYTFLRVSYLGTGAIYIKLIREVPLRDIQILHNRIEKMIVEYLPS